MSDQVRVVAGSHQKAAQDTRAAHDQITAEISRIRGHVETAHGSGWQGQGGDAMIQTAENWITTATQVASILEVFEEKLLKVDTNNAQVEEERGSSFQSVMARLQV